MPAKPYGKEQYVNEADELIRRITALIPDHPEILDLTSPWDLFRVEGFDCADIGPTLFQASFALEQAKKAWDER